MNNLYLFTASFPYNTAETFLEEEILYLSKAFNKVTIIPLIGTGSPTRSIPANCFSYQPIIKNKREEYLKGLFCLRAMPVFISDFFKKRVFFSFKRLKTWFIAYVLTSNVLKSKNVKEVFSNIDKTDICYFYWGKGANVLSYFYKKKALFVSRFHGEWDLWEESSGNYGPIRQQVADSLDMVAFISKKGMSYFSSRYGGEKCVYSPLGSSDYGIPAQNKKSDVVQIVSCSTVYPLKRVDLLYKALRTINNIKVEWTHIGGGSGFESLRKDVLNNDNKELQINLLGKKKHDEVIEIYKNKRFDVFINLSTNEGVPVSIMEAESFDVPIIATNVGGTSEVVAPETGILISPNPTIKEITGAIESILDSKDMYHPREFWNKCFNSDINYKNFCVLLKKLQNGKQQTEEHE